MADAHDHVETLITLAVEFHSLRDMDDIDSEAWFQSMRALLDDLVCDSDRYRLYVFSPDSRPRVIGTTNHDDKGSGYEYR